MLLLQPVDMGRDQDGAGLDPTVVAFHRGVGGLGVDFRVVEEVAEVNMQGTLVPFSAMP